MSTVDPFKVTAPASAAPHANIDWPATKEAILARLDIAAEFAALGLEVTGKPNGKGWTECRAMGRTDVTPSAAINVMSGIYHDSGGDGTSCILFDFALRFAGERFGRWMDVMKFYAGKAGIELGKVHSHSGGRIREAEYPYKDASGEIRYCVFRYRQPNGRKTFSQHPPDGRGGWRFGAGCMDGIEPIPYRLPELLTSTLSNEAVWVVEGEKDVERLRREGFTATTNHQGSQSTDATWPKFLPYFKNREVFIVPDNDPAGRIHARKVAAHLHGTAAVVKIVELPGLASKGDISDWLDLGHTPDELGKLAHAAKIWDAADDGLSLIGGTESISAPTAETGEKQTEAIIVRLSDVVARPVEWLVPNKIPLGKLTLIAGQPGIGKSYLTMDLIARVTVGGEVPGPSGGECVKEGSVVLLSAEDDLADTIRPRLDAAGADCERVNALTTLRLPDGTFEPFSLSYIPLLEKAIDQVGDVKLVVIDPVTSYIGGKVDDHRNSALRVLLEPLAELASRLAIAIVIVTHLNKGASANAINRVTGSLAYIALARAAWLVVRDPDDDPRRLFLSIKNNLAPDPSGLAYRIDGSGRIVWETDSISQTANDVLREHSKGDRGDREEKPQTKTKQAETWLAENLPPGTEVNSTDLTAQAKAAGISRTALWEAKKALEIGARKEGAIWMWINPPKITPISDARTVGQLDGSQPF